MSNTWGGTDVALIGQAGLEAFKAALAPIRALSFDIDSEPSKKAATIEVPLITAMTAGSFSSSYESGDTTTTQVQVSLGTQTVCPWHITDVESSKKGIDVWAMQARESAYAVGKAIVQAVLDDFTLANYGDTAADKITVAEASFDVDDVVDLVDLMDDNNVPEGNRSLILTNAGMTALRKDNALQDASASGDALTLREGSVGRVSGLDIFRCNAFPTALTDENTYGIGLHPSAMAVAIRPVVPQPGASDAGLMFEIFTDPETGISLGFRSWYNTATGIRWGTFEALHGNAVGQANGASRIVSA